MRVKGSGHRNFARLATAAAITAAAIAAAPASADHAGIAHPPGDATRAYELVSPPYKISGAGVGAPLRGSTAHRIQTQAGAAGTGAYLGERFAVGSNLGATMLDSAFATANDWAFAERVSDDVGWRSHSPVTHPFHCPEDYRMQLLQQAAPDFSTVVWTQNAAKLPFFEEMCEPIANFHGTSLISDWGSPPESPTRWEPIGPLELSQTGTGAGDNYFGAPAVSADGSHVAVSGPVRGLAGDGDPTRDTVGSLPHAAYIDDVSAGLSDSWPGAGIRIPAAACTGVGSARTRIPQRGGGGNLVEAACEERESDRDSRLVSDHGSSITWQTQASFEVGTSNTNVISADGSRTFFMAPDPQQGLASCTADVGPATRCPAQLYVRQRNSGGEVVTRWVSRPDADMLAGGYPASLLGQALFEGASADGSVVFFRTASPLTADDPNGPCGAPCTTGARNLQSWDLYMFEFAAGPDPTGPGSELTRVTGGPAGVSDCNTQPDQPGPSENAAALRFSSQDARRVYFACSAPLGGVADRDASLLPAGVQGGTPAEVDQTNIYLYDVGADLYTFVARIPRGISDPSRCASTAALRGSVLQANGFNRVNCWRGTDDGGFATFWTLGRLTADDPVGVESADIYGYDAASDELVRVSASQGPPDAAYECGSDGVVCHADQGLHSGAQLSVANPPLTVVADPGVAGERTVFFESASRLVDDGDGPRADDENDVFDVYRWRDGELSLVSSGAPDSDGAAYKGNSADGRNVYFMTADRLTWQDVDSVADIYTARVGGGIPAPAPAPVCGVLAGVCHGGGAAAVATTAPLGGQGGGDASPGARKRLALGRLGPRARRRAARSGVIRLRLRVSEAGRVTVIVRGRVGARMRRVGRTSKTLARPGAATVRVRLSRRARGPLRKGRRLRVAIQLRSAGAIPKSLRVSLRRAGK